MKNLFSVVICLLVSVLWQSAGAQQWIIDGQRVQSLEIHVSDPQAVYTDGSRIIQAPLVYAQSCSSPTSGLFRAYFAPEEQYEHFFLIDGNSEAVTLSSSANAGFKVGRTIISSSSLYNEDANVGMQFDDHLLSGGWNVDTVPDSPDAVMNRSYADNRYLRKPGGLSTNRVIQAGNTLVISNGLITAILP